MKKILLLLIIPVLSLSCQSQNDSKVKVLPVADYKVAIAKSDVVIVDVRTPEEFAQGAVPNAQNINVTNASFEIEIQKLDKTKPVYVYCRSGARSQTAAKKMAALGFTEIIDLKGGYLAWY
jgi:rhodanese-related sulfurtransferase